MPFTIKGVVMDIITIAIALFVSAYILPPALTAIATATLTSVNAGVTTIFQVLLPLVAVLAVAIHFFYTLEST
jgi:hypothetical protein